MTASHRFKNGDFDRKCYHESWFNNLIVDSSEECS